MVVTLLTSPATITNMEAFAALGHLTCHANADKDFVPQEVLTRAIKAGHETTLEHIALTYSVRGLSRDCLQELARHRHISLSVESTRHTTKKNVLSDEWVAVTEFSVLPQFIQLFRSDIAELRQVIKGNPEITNDELKYRLRGYWPTNLIVTTNIRELRHILTLRTSPAALKEFQDLARKLFEAVPSKFKYLLEDCVYGNCSETPNSSEKEEETA